VDSDTIKGIAQTYFDARRSRDVDRLRSILADDVSFRVRSVPPTASWSHVGNGLIGRRQRWR
jgi:ketosteroid isomerase-like protein